MVLRKNRWSRDPDLNRRPADYESAALPTELPRPIKRGLLQKFSIARAERQTERFMVSARRDTSASPSRMQRGETR
jgi:hypothetical protein